ncbi:MAG: aconitate hydratase [candidate division NC10 bacterium]|nr:aconitate hydratase [candidate division NC10 bacterium]
MGRNLVQKIFEAHLVEGELTPGREIAVTVDQTLTQDATGTMASLQFEAVGIPKVRTKLSVSYVDHNMLQEDFKNMDDHLFLQTFAAKYGIYFSKPGNGICHQVHLERFAVPGQILLGSDSHTPTSGGMGMIAIGVGGLDVALAMAGAPFYLKMPKVVSVRLSGSLQPWVAAKDIILELLRRLTVKGGLGKIFEYGGEGVKSLTVPEQATITNMGAELGATTSLFPSDERTRAYLKAQGREEVWKPLQADPDAGYDEVIEIDLSTLEPMVACPPSPDNVRPIREVEGTPIGQVIVGSCTNSSYRDLMVVAKVLEDKKVHPMVSFHINPGSRQVYETVARKGALTTFIAAGARLSESGCLGCIGMGQAPGSGVNSLRTFNRNWPARYGGSQIFLASPEVAVATAITGAIADPRKLGPFPKIPWPRRFALDDSAILPPSSEPERVEIHRGPNIKPLPTRGSMEQHLEGEVLLKVGDDISTDHIMPAGSKILPLRSNIPAMAEYVFEPVDPTFPRRAKEKGGGFVVGGVNYGQGSSREHAALAPMDLGLKAVLARTFARIHRANLINFGILPLSFVDEQDSDRIEQGDRLAIEGVLEQVRAGTILVVKNLTKGITFQVRHDFTPREIEILAAGGRLNHARKEAEAFVQVD